MTKVKQAGNSGAWLLGFGAAVAGLASITVVDKFFVPIRTTPLWEVSLVWLFVFLLDLVLSYKSFEKHLYSRPSKIRFVAGWALLAATFYCAWVISPSA